MNNIKEFLVNQEVLREVLNFRETKVIIVLIIGLILDLFLNFVLKKIFINRLSEKLEEEKRGKISTVFSLFRGLKSLILWIIVLLIVLSIYKIKITSILASLGIIGVIVGFASQALISDILSGIFIILDRLYLIGDRIKIGDIEGEVVEITLRRTYIKDDQGYLHSIPNSQIKQISKKITQQ